MSAFFTLLLLLTVVSVEPTRRDINTMMYVDVPNGAACFRRLNGTHQFGCSSPHGGSTGVVQMIEDDNELNNFVATAVAGPYIVVLPPSLFNTLVVDRLVISGKVSGILLAIRSNTPPPTFYSPDDTCPNRNNFCDANSTWNPAGNSFLIRDWPFPVFLLQDDERIQNISDCFQDFNVPVDEGQLTRPLCMLQLKSHMFGAVSSQVCMRRTTQQFMGIFKYCDPMGNENIVHPMIDFKKSVSKKIILIVARLDAASMFDNMAPGAMSAISGMTGLILLAAILERLPVDNLNYGVMLMLLNGETFDYIGSQRVVYDMENGAFFPPENISIHDIAFVVELSQLGPGSKLVLHPTNDQLSKEFASNLTTLSTNFQMSTMTQMPPTSLITFIKANPKLSGIVVTNYDRSFTNRYYNGIYDTAMNMNYSYAKDVQNQNTAFNIASGVDVLARGLYRLINDKATYDSNITETVRLSNEILNCYLVSRQCDLFQKLYPILAVAKNPDIFSYYVGISSSVSHITRATWKVLGYFSSPKKRVSPEKCSEICSTNAALKCFWVKDSPDGEVRDDNNGTCVLSPIKIFPAVSPAFEIEGYDWSSGQYSTWTESVWADISVRLFVKGTNQKDVVVFSTGLFVLILSTVTVYVISNKYESLFAPKVPGDSC